MTRLFLICIDNAVGSDELSIMLTPGYKLVNAEQRNFVTVFLTVFGWMFCAVYGWSGAPEDSSLSASESDVLTIKFISQNGGTMRKVEIPARPGVSFAVKTNDEAGNHYLVTGKLLQKAGHSVGLEQVQRRRQAADGTDGFSGVGPSELERGREWSVHMVAGITLYMDTALVMRTKQLLWSRQFLARAVFP